MYSVSSWFVLNNFKFTPLLLLFIGQFSEAGLLEWMRFVIFQQRSRGRSQRTSGPISE